MKVGPSNLSIKVEESAARQLKGCTNAIEVFASLMLGETWRDQLSLVESEDFQRLLEIYYPIGAVNLISNFDSVRVLATKNAKEKMNEVS